MLKALQHKYFFTFIFLLLAFSSYAKPLKSEPVALMFYPSLEATSVNPAVNIEIVFDQPIIKGSSGFIFIKDYNNGAVYFQFDVSSSFVMVSGDKVTIDLPSNLPLGKRVYINIDDSAFESPSGDNFGGIATNSVWNFTTASYVIDHANFNPAPASSCVSLQTTLTLELTEPVSIGNGLIKVLRKSDFTVYDQFNASGGYVSKDPNNSRKLFIALPKSLQPNTTYSILIEPTAFFNTTGAYIGLLNPEVWYFTTQQAAPSVTVIPDDEHCGEATFTLKVESYAGGTSAEYRWFDKPDGEPLKDQNNNIISGDTFVTPLLTENKNYFVAQYRQGCLSAKAPIELKIHPIPNISITPDTEIFLGASIRLDVSGGVSYKWLPNENIDNNTIPNPTVSPTQTTTYTVEVTSEKGCISTAQVTITVKENEVEVFLPNLFSPNGDSKNDLFRVLSKNTDTIETIDFRIYDRSGNVLYQTRDVQEAVNTGWDGRVSGVLQPTDTYVWYLSGTYKSGKIITFDNKNTGSFVLMR